MKKKTYVEIVTNELLIFQTTHFAIALIVINGACNKIVIVTLVAITADTAPLVTAQTNINWL